jgi:hypothetical protein
MAIFDVEAVLGKQEVKRIGQQLRAVLARAARGATFAEREEFAIAVTNGLLRDCLRQDLVEVAASLGERVELGGETYRRHQEGTGVYHSLVGGLDVQRWTYRLEGVRNGPTICPLELEAGLVFGATPAFAKNVAHGFAEHDMRTHLTALQLAGRQPPSRSTLERIAAALGTDVAAAQVGVEKKVRRMEPLPEGATAISVGVDRTSVAMREPVAPERVTTRSKRKKPYKRTPPDPYEVAFRMAYVGTVSVVDGEGKALAVRRYAVPAEDDASEMIGRMMADVLAMKRREATLTVGVVQDGAPEMWNLARAGLRELQVAGVIAHWREGIDRMHLLEHLGKALALTDRTEQERHALLAQWSEAFDEHDDAIEAVEATLRLDVSSLQGKAREDLEAELTYLRNNKDRMRYVTLRLAGLPVGSGVTESAAKTVIGLRSKRGGQQWGDNLRGVLALRGIVKSERFAAFWMHYARRHAANVNDVGAAA